MDLNPFTYYGRLSSLSGSYSNRNYWSPW